MLITKLNFLSSPSLWKRHFWENHKRGSNWAPSSQFFKDYYPIKKIRSKIQRILRDMKNELSKQEYVRLYPGGSYLVKFYKTTEVRKFSKDSTVDDILLRTIVWNFGTVTYGLAKYLTKLLSRLSHITQSRTPSNLWSKYIRNMYQMVTWWCKIIWRKIII